MKSKLKGWDTVFKFTLIQNIKSKNFIVSTILLAVIIFVLIPFSAKSSGSSTLAGDILTVDVEKLYCYDESGVLGNDIKANLIEAAEKEEIDHEFAHMKVEKLEISQTDKDAENGKATKADIKDAVKDAFCQKEDCDDSLLIISTIGEAGYDIEVVRTEDSNIGEVTAGMFEECLSASLYSGLYETAGITPEQVKFVGSTNEITFTTVSAGQVNEADSDDVIGENFMTGTSTGMTAFMVVLMLLAIGGELASTSMITEKASRAIEYVLTSIKPMALITGKVLACIAGVLIQMAVLIGSGAASIYLFTHGGTRMTSTTQMAQSLGVTSMVDNFSIIRVIMALAVIVGGVIFYLTLACLIGSTASKMEELTHTNMIYSFVLIAGAYTGMILTMNNFGEGSMVQKFILIFPLSSPFTTPSFVLAGDCSIKVALVSVIVMMISVVVLMLIVAKVFEAVIMYTGSKVTFKKMLEFAGLKKRGEGDE